MTKRTKKSEAVKKRERPAAVWLEDGTPFHKIQGIVLRGIECQGKSA